MKHVFLSNGYEATSLDDLVNATGLLRGSLYAAFGSKRSMFLEVLNACLEKHPNAEDTWEIILIGMIELSSRDKLIRNKLKVFLDNISNDQLIATLGKTIVRRSKINGDDIYE
ncbi:TetR/AcrR family transcriptional regulator [Apilactobacillus xinyiensis]